MQNIEVGAIVEGRITGITNFGVFADIGDGKTGMVHISEVALTYVNDIHDFVKENDVVKMKVLSISDDGKIALSIKRAQAAEKPQKQKQNERPAAKSETFTGFAKHQSEPETFEEMLSRFKQTSDEKISDLKRKNFDSRRAKRSSAAK